MGSEFVMGARFELDDEFSQPMSEMSKTSQEFQQSLNNSSGTMARLNEGFINTGKTMQNWGATASAAITAPLMGIGTAAVWTTATFDDSMSKVRALSGATGDEFDALRSKALELGSTTAHSASAASDAMGYLALAGFNTNEILAATPAMLSLASAASMDLATSADIVSDTMSAFQMEATRAGEAADIFAKIQASSNTDVMMLGEAMKYAGAAANAAGMDLAQTSAVMGVLADSGIKGSMAGTTFTSMLSDMRKNSKNGAFAVGKMSVSLYDAQGNMRDLGNIMYDVEQATKGMSTAARDAAMSNIFGEQAMKGVNIMLATGSERYFELEEAAYGSAGAASEMAAIMEDNVGGAMRSMKSAIEGFMISIGDELKGYVQMGAQFVGNLALAFTNLNPAIRRSIVIIGAIAAAIGPVLAVLGTLSVIIGTIGVPVAAAVLAVGALIAILVTMYSTSETFRNGVHNAFNSVKNTIIDFWNAARVIFANVVESIRSLWQAAQPVREGLIKNVLQAFQWVAEQVPAVLNTLVTFVTGIWNRINQTSFPILSSLWRYITTGFTLLVNTLGPILQMVWQVITTVWGTIRDHVLPLVLNFVEMVVSFFQLLVTVLQPILMFIMGLIVDVWSMVLEYILPFMQNLFDTIVNTWNRIWEATGPLLSSLVEGITGIFDGLRVFFETWWPVIYGLFTVAWAVIRGIISAVLPIITGIISNGFNLIMTIISSVWSVISGIIQVAWSLISGLIQTGLAILSGDWEGAWNAMLGMLDGVWNGIKTFFGGLVDFFFESGKAIINTLVDGIKSVAMAPVNAIKGVFDSVRNLLPFSDAKTGPLSDLTYSGGAILTTMAEGINKKRNTIAAAMENALGFDSPSVSVAGVPEFYTTLNVATLFDNAEVPEFNGSANIPGGNNINPAGTAGGGTTHNSRSTVIENLNVEVNAAEGQDPEEVAAYVIDMLNEKIGEADEVLGTDKGDLL